MTTKLTKSGRHQRQKSWIVLKNDGGYLQIYIAQSAIASILKVIGCMVGCLLRWEPEAFKKAIKFVSHWFWGE